VDESSDKLSRSAVIKVFLLATVCLDTVIYSHTLRKLFALHCQ